MNRDIHATADRGGSIRFAARSKLIETFAQMCQEYARGSRAL